MRYFDFHCDTLYRAINENKTLNESGFHLSVDRGKKFKQWTQCMAIWISDDLRGDVAYKTFLNAYDKLVSECKKNEIKLLKNIDDIKNNEHNIIFTVENGSALGGKINNVKKFKECGVKIVTLTWNASNEIGGGAEANPDLGLTEFGKTAVKEFESNGIICDVSHANDKLFNDVAQIAAKPFIATHSNSRTITDHKRNLTDDQFKIIKSFNGIVGLNFCNMFLNKNKDNASIYDIIKHTEHFLSIGGENTICIGSDFDGTDMPIGIRGIEDIENLYEAFLKENYSESLVRNIFWDNALNFWQNFDNKLIL